MANQVKDEKDVFSSKLPEPEAHFVLELSDTLGRSVSWSMRKAVEFARQNQNRFKQYIHDNPA